MNNEKKIVLFTGAAHYLTHFYELAFPALAIPLMRSLDMDLADVLKLGFLMYLLYGVAALPAGIAADRFGNRKSLIVFFLGTGAGAMVTSFSQSALSLSFSLAFIGLFASIYHPAGMGLISIGVKNRGMALGINGVAGNIGLVSAPFVAGLLNWIVGWQITYLLIGIFSIAWGMFLFFTSINETPIHVHEKGPRRATEGTKNYLRYFAILCVIMTLAGLAYRANSVILPAYLELKASFLWDLFNRLSVTNAAGAKTMAATLLASAIYTIGIFGQLLGGRLADRYDLRWLYLLFHGMSLPFVIAMGFFSQELLVLSAGLYILFSLGMQPIENSLVATFTPSRWRSTSYGIKFILTFGVGSLSVYIVGWIKEAWNLGTVYYFMGGLIVVFLLLICLLILVSRNLSIRNIPLQ